MAKLFLLFVIMPIVEIAVLINVGEIIGGWNTVALVILSALVGAHLVRREGLSTMAKAQQKMQEGQIPAEELGAGLLLLVAGVLLVTPGFITDIFGLLLTLPYTRGKLAKFVMQNMQMVGGARGFSGGFQAGGFRSGTQQDPNSPFGQGTPFGENSPFGSDSQQGAGDIIDGEVVNKTSSSDTSETPKRLE